MREDDLQLLSSSAATHIVLDDDAQRRRILIVGDIHGCCDELKDLLATYHKPEDTIIFAGDLINKGPRSREVLRVVRSLERCYAIVGNHELAVLRGRADRDGGKFTQNASKYAWTDLLHPDDVDYIKSLPFTISLPLHKAIVVHAGLVPKVALAEQSRRDMVTMRDLRRGAETDAEYEACEAVGAVDSAPWASVWSGPEHVYFGHDAKRRLQRYPFATGLDTGCLYGGQLSAAILEIGKPTRIVSVTARMTYAQPGTPPWASKQPSGSGVPWTWMLVGVLSLGLLGLGTYMMQWPGVKGSGRTKMRAS